MARRAAGLSLWSILGRRRTLGGVAYDIARHTHGKFAHQAITQKAETVIEKHLPSLVRRREQLVRQDAYGKKVLNDWLKEIGYFIATCINHS